MKEYKNNNGNSAVARYENGADYIKVEFLITRHILKFSYRSAGKVHIEEMKKLADTGCGLGSYIDARMNIR